MSTTSHAPPVLRLSMLLDHRVIHWSVSAAWLGILLWQGASKASLISDRATSLLPWMLLLMIINLLPVIRWQSAQFVIDAPLQTAAALVLSPIEVGIVCFVASIDPRELTRRVRFGKALFNRSQVALIHYIGAWIIHRISAAPARSSQLIPLALIYLGFTMVVNYLLIGAVMSREQRVPFSVALRRLRLGMLPDFVLSCVTWAVMGAMLAALFDQVGLLALFAFLAPTLLGRQVLTRSQMVVDTTKAFESKEMTIAKLENQISEERSDERRLIAADLHDEVLQPLFKVTLMAHVLKADLANGRLLEIDADLPELLSAAETASQTLRDLIGDLRRSSLGVGGLPGALTRLIEVVRQQSRLEISEDIDEVEPDPVTQLVIYQVAKEALSNVVTHAQGHKATLHLSNDAEYWVLEVTDDGIGFDLSAEVIGHFGIPIMRERTMAMGGSFYLDSAPGKGCRIQAMLPKPKDRLNE
jgi:signal transduction histidine kinase